MQSEGTHEDMCGIVGLRLKNPDLHNVLGELVVPMLDVLASRGPDSTGVAIYSDDAPEGELKFSPWAPEEGPTCTTSSRTIVALAVEAAAMAKVPPAGTDWIPAAPAGG